MRRINELDLYYNKFKRKKINTLNMYQNEDQKKIALLQEYCETLERQNFAKNNETALIYEQLDSLRQQNDTLKSFIEATNVKWEEERKMLTEKILEKENQQVLTSRNFGDQLRNSVDISSLKAVAEDMRVQLQQKQNIISQLTEHSSNLETQVHQLKLQLTELTTKMTKSQQRLRNQMQYAKQLQNQIFGLKNSKSETRVSTMSFAKLQADKLVKQNNQLIEKIRMLEKQKNGYYNQLKLASPLKSRVSNHDSRSSQKRSQCLVQGGQTKPQKSQRWNQMQQKLRSIRSENEQLRANLAIY